MEESREYIEAAAAPWDGFVLDQLAPLSRDEQHRLNGKRVLITGAGGFLGSALARALARLPLQRLVLLDNAEYGLYRLEQDLVTTAAVPDAVFTVGSIYDRALVRELFAEHAPEVVFHAAALKHVPLMESNAIAAAKTNALGTQVLVEQAAKRKTECFVLLSTDKAVEPISVMGATKRIAEQILLAERQGGNTAFRAVRLCNVLGSTGSVAPLFARQIARGGPVTVSHPEATRFFMSGNDAVMHLLRAAVHPSATGLTAPNAGTPRRVEDLTRYLMQQTAHGPASIAITYTGLRPADKLHERLLARDESGMQQQSHPYSIDVNSRFDLADFTSAMAEIRTAVSDRDEARLMTAIGQAVPGYPAARMRQRAASEVWA